MRFKKPMKWPVTGAEYAGVYAVEGVVPDALSKLYVCLVNVPGCWPVSRLKTVSEV